MRYDQRFFLALSVSVLGVKSNVCSDEALEPESSTVAAVDYPKIRDADWSIQILSSASRIVYLGQTMLVTPVIC